MDANGLFRFVGAAVFSLVFLAGCSAEVDPSPLATGVEVEPDTSSTPASSPDGFDLGQDRSAEAVGEVFEEYRAALLDLDGERASRVVTQSTFVYYDRILDAGLNATPDELLDSIPLSDALGVLAMRAQLGTGLRDVPNGAELFAIGVDRGLVGENVGTVQFDRINVEGDEAFGVLQGLEAMRFEYVEGGWYFDLPFTTSFIDENEDDFIRGLTGGSADRSELYTLIAFGYDTTWEDLSTPAG